MTGTDEERQAFQDAYQAWKECREAHDDRMRVAMSGGPYDYDAAMREVTRMNQLLADFMEKSKPFVRWGSA